MKSDKLEALRKDETRPGIAFPLSPRPQIRPRPKSTVPPKRLRAFRSPTRTAEAARVKAKAAIKTTVAEEKKAAESRRDLRSPGTQSRLPVSVFVSTKTSTIKVRQGWEILLRGSGDHREPGAASRDLPDVRHELAGLEPDLAQLDDCGSNREFSRTGTGSVSEDEFGKKRKNKEPALPLASADGSATPQPRSIASRSRRDTDKISEVVKPGSTFIVSDYDISRSETRFAGTDFIVQMPEVVAKITRPKPKRDEYYDDDNYWLVVLWRLELPEAPPGSALWWQVLLLVAPIVSCRRHAFGMNRRHASGMRLLSGAA